MKFGPIPVAEAEGAILAHGVRTDALRLPKAKMLTADDVAALATAGVETVVAARLEPGDVDEDNAAARIAGAMQGFGFAARKAATGRVNLHATEAGVFSVNPDLVDRLNRIDPAITLATLRPFASVAVGRMVATVKIIPFGLSDHLVQSAESVCLTGEMMAVHPFRSLRIALIQTVLSATKHSVLDKTSAVTAARLERTGNQIASDMRCDHDRDTLAQIVAEASGDNDLVIVFGASATSDAEDVIPGAIQTAGGRVSRVGMPVDPGNLITTGTVGDATVIGAPGCARSPKENGFDWVLERTIAGMDVGSSDIESMGVGGLLNEIAARPRPRDMVTERTRQPAVHGLLLAAGRSSRMRGSNKLLALFDGVPLVRRSAGVLIDAGLAVTVVTGHESERVEQALDGLELSTVHNADYASGLSTSLRTGMGAVGDAVDGVLVMLCDMPDITSSNIKELTAAFVDAGGHAIVRATHAGKRGNPVIIPEALFGALSAIQGDMGARQIVESGDAPVVDVEIGSAASVDVDTPELLKAAGGTAAP